MEQIKTKHIYGVEILVINIRRMVFCRGGRRYSICRKRGIVERARANN